LNSNTGEPTARQRSPAQLSEATTSPAAELYLKGDFDTFYGFSRRRGLRATKAEA
jgi:hypothetical protein